MSCKVFKNANGSINSVLNTRNEESKLFERINNDLFIGGVSETSLNIYNTSLTDEIKNLYGEEEPTLYFQNKSGKIYTDMEEAIISNNGGGSFKFGYSNPNTQEFIKVGEFNTEATPISSFLTSAVKTGLISTQREYNKETGESFIKGKGSFEGTTRASAQAFKIELAESLGKVARVDGDRITVLPDSGDYITVVKKDGSISNVSKLEVQEALTSNNVENKAEIYVKTQNLLNKTFKTQSTSTPNLNNYKNNLEGFLKGLGFTVTTLENYEKSYEMRHGSSVDVAGLVDLANRVVAIAEGENVSRVITEEVAHLAIEAYSDQESIVSALVEVVETEEYRQFADIYREKYSDEYSGVELEEKVRKEILGKVVAKGLAENTLSETNTNIWQAFVNWLQSRFKPFKRTALETITNNIKKAIGTNDLSQFQSDFSKGGVFFSLKNNEQITKQLKNAFESLQQIAKQAKKTSENTVLSVRTANFSNTDLSNLETLSRINDISTALKTNLETIALKNKDKGADMNFIDYTVFNSLYEKTFPDVEAFNKWLNDTQFTDVEKNIAKSIQEDVRDLMEKFSNLNASVKNNYETTYTDLLTEHVLSDPNLTNEQKDEVMRETQGIMKDLNSFTRLLTSPSNSSSPFVRIAGKIITDMDTSLKSNFRKFFQESTNMFEKQGWKKSQKSVIAKDKKGKNTYFFEDGVDWAGAEELVQNDIAGYIKTILPKEEIKNIKQELNTKLPNEVLEDLLKKENPSITDEEILEKQKELSEVSRVSEYKHFTHFYTYKKVENDQRLNSIANVSEESYEIEEAFRRQLNDIKSKYYENGRFVEANLTESDAFLIKKIERDRRIKRSPISSSGEVLVGLEDISWEEMSVEQKEFLNEISRKVLKRDFNPSDFAQKSFVVLDRGTSLNSLTSDARYSLDMANLNITRMLENIKKGINISERVPTNEHISDLESFKDSDEIIRNFLETVNMEFTDEFYDLQEENSADVLEYMQEQIDNETDTIKKTEKEDALENYKKLTRTKSRIRRAYRSTNNSTEIEVNDLSSSTRSLWIDIDNQLSAIRRKFKLDEREQGESITERVLSSSFSKMVKDKGVNEYSFALEHMSENAKLRVQKFRQYLTYSLDESINIVPNKKFEETLDRLVTEYEINTDVDDNILLEAVATAYAKENLASYFYGYDLKNKLELQNSLSNALQNGEITVRDLYDENTIKRYNNYVKFTPSYSNSEQDANPEFVDKDYNPIKGRQPRLVNESFFSKYGITKDEYNKVADVTELEARTNVEDFNFLKFAVQNNKKANEIYDTHTNIMLRPQMSTTLYEKIKNVSYFKDASGNVKDLIKDTFSDRVDEMEYGDQDYNKIGIKVIPKMFRRRIESPDMLTENIFQASIALAREAEAYKQKTHVKEKIDAVIDQATKREYKKGGFLKSDIKVTGEISETVKGVQEIADNYIYGIKQNTKLEFNFMGTTIDLTRFLSTFQKYSSYVNLAYSPLISLTSLSTGLYGNAENTLVGELYSKSASRKGNAEMLKDISGYIASEGKINNKSRMAALVDFFGIHDMTERLSNSGSSRAERLLSESPFMMDSMANIPVLFKPLYTLLYDYRYNPVSNSYLNYGGFKAHYKTTHPNAEKQDIKNAWAKLENDSMMNALDFNKETGAIKIKQEVIDKIGEDNVKRLINDISSKARIIGQQVDGVMTETDKVLAQRNVLLNTLMQHRGFLFINFARALKSRNYNYHTKQFEEGYINSGLFLLGNLIKQRGNLRKAIGALDDMQKANVKRLTIRTVLTNLLLLAAMGFRATDDDDDTFAEDLARVITYRTYNEVDDLSLMGMSKTLMASIEEPIVLSGTLKTFYKVGSSITDSDKEFDWVNMRRLMLAKSYDQFGDLHKYTINWLSYKDTELAPIFNYDSDRSIFQAYGL